MNREIFIELIRPIVVRVCLEEKFKFPSLIIAMAAKESGWFKSSLATEHGNMLGRKWSTNSITPDYVELPTKEWVKDKDFPNGHYIDVLAKFCKYKNVLTCFKDFVKLLKERQRYQPVMKCMNYRCACEQISKCGYATSPTYSESLKKIIEDFQLNKLDS